MISAMAPSDDWYSDSAYEAYTPDSFEVLSMWRWLDFWKTSRILIRGSVAFSPLLLSSSACVMGAPQRGGRPRPTR